MVIEVKTDLPPTYKIRKAAEALSLVMPYGTKAVYSIGHGSQRDWEGGVGRIYSEYLDDLVVVFAPQDDYKRPGGYRPLQKPPRNLRVRGASSGLIFDTSSKEFTSVDGIDIPTSSSQSGAWVDLLRSADYLGIPQFFSSVTTDFLGISTVPIEPVYIEKSRSYFGPRRFIELNLVSLKVAASQIKNGKPHERFREQLAAGEIVPTRLRRYEMFLRQIGAWKDDKLLEDVVMPNLNLIVEPALLEKDEKFSLPYTLSGVLRHA